ncbi:MAG: hypothetical protein QOJ03_3402 [Frankiaceae bacterium]|nr:hypothetical protein [Frankiaceae bacterium]
MSPRRDMNDGRDDRLEALLRNALHEEADAVAPAGDGLSRIQRRVGADRARQRWLRPALGLGSVALLAALGVGVYAVTNGTTGKDTIVPGDVTQTPTSSETPEPTPSETTVPVATDKFPRLAIFPFTSAEDEKTWEQAYADGHEPWKADPTAVSQFWVNNYLQQPAIDKVISKTLAADGKSAEVTLGRTMTAEQKKTVPVTVVQLVQYGKGWVVVGAADAAAPPYQVTVATPTPGTTVRAPLTVSGPGGFGVEESVQVDVRDAASATSYGTGVASFGNGVPTWSVDVSFRQPTGPNGVLVATEDSAADGGPQRLVAVPVQFGEGSGTAAPPQFFYAIKNGRVTKFASRNGAAIDYLTDPQPGGGAEDPQLSRDGKLVYFLQNGGTCVNGLMSVSTATSDNTPPTTSVASPDAGYVITGYSVDSQLPGETRYAFFEQACDSSADPQAKLVMLETSGSRHVIKYHGLPPTIVGDPSYEPTAQVQLIDAIVRTGTSGYIARYDDVNDNTPTPQRHACPGLDPNDGQPEALEMDASGVLYVALQTGSSMDVVRCGVNKPRVVFSVAGNDQPADVDVANDGSSILLTDDSGKVWRWDGSGNAVELSPSVPLTHVTW